MISVVLYGRNDSYGYNLHKRAVLSLNCIAELLDDPDDEILFVDYNTPDDLPTFVEAVGDLLTPRGRERTKVLRVRPSQHARFASRTHLKALECPARNAAIRRSNPQNRWILSTNTDMVFLSRTGQSLSAFAADLPDGFYHTARFELPEALWETLDRKDPRACIESIRYWGQRLQLQEVCYGTPYTMFDGPGDFQLFLRDDAFRMSGFDERMLLGWHCDSNLARRLGLLRNESVKSALDHVLAFHCDHNRETTPMHAHGAVQNDWQTFVPDLTEAGVPEQRETWGFAGEAIEEIRIEEYSKIATSLEQVLPPMQRPFHVSSIWPEIYQDFGYDPEHVVPYVANVIAALPKHWNVLYAGCRKSMFKYFVEMWRQLGFTGNVLVPDYVAAMSLEAQENDTVKIVEESRAHEAANLFVFEIGASDDDKLPAPIGARDMPLDAPRTLSQGDHMKLRIVHRTFVRAVAAERARAGAQRRFVLINMQANPMDSTVEARVGASWTPTSTHVKHGFVLPDPFVATRSDAADWMLRHLRGPWHPNKYTLEKIAAQITDGAALDEFGAYLETATWLLDLLNHPEAAGALGVTHDRLTAVIEYIEQNRASERTRREMDVAIEARIAPRSSLSRIVAIEDFDDLEWGRVAVRVTGVGAHRSILARTRFPWESSHVVYVLEKTGTINGSVTLLQHPNDPKFTAQKLVGTLIDWAGACALFDVTRPVAQEAVHDAVVVSTSATINVGVEKFPKLMQMADSALKIGGIAVFVFDPAVADKPDDLDLPLLRSGVFEKHLYDATAWKMQGPLELGLSAATVDMAMLGEKRHSNTGAHYDGAGNLRALCIVVWEKTGVTAPGQWERFRKIYLDQRPALVRA